MDTRTPRPHQRHINIIHEEDALLPGRRAEQIFSLLFEFALDGLLRDQTQSLRTKIHKCWDHGEAALVGIRLQAPQQILDHDRLARARHARHKNRFIYCN